MNWQQRINRAKKTGGFTEDDRNKVMSFNSCAVSERIGWRNSLLSDDFFNLGIEFCKYIDINNIPKAEATYKKIQRLKI